MRIIQFLMPILLLKSYTAQSQSCSCCNGNSGNVSFNYASNGVGELKKGQLQAELLTEQRVFKSLTADETESALNSYGLVTNTKNLVAAIGKFSIGLSNRFSLSLIAPYVFMHGKMYNSTAEKTEELNTKSFADISILSSFSLYTNCTSQLTCILIGGVELPTARKGINTNGLIVGSGSFDPIIGASFKKVFYKTTFKANVGYKYTTTGYEGIDFGNSFNYSISALYSLTKRSIDSVAMLKRKPMLNTIFTFSGESIAEQYKENILLHNTGSYRVYVGAGLSLLTNKRCSFYSMVDLPVLQKQNGIQNFTAFKIKAGVSYLLN